MTRSWRDLAYRALRLSNDVRAVETGRVPERIERRIVGRLVGRAMGRWLR